MTRDPSPGTPQLDFDVLRQNADEVLRMQTRAASLIAERQAVGFDGFSDLLDRVLPREKDALQRVADALRLRVSQLGGLRAGELDPAGLPRDDLALLGQVLGLERDAFLALVVRDHERFAAVDDSVMSRSDREIALQLERVSEWERFRLAWDRAEADNPTDL